MAIYHLSATAVQRSKGHSAVAGAAYRSGMVLRDVMTGQTHDYQRKRGIVQSEIIAPENAPAWTHDREALWNHAELAEKRRDGQPAREIRLALPSELTDEQRADLVFTYAQDMFASSGMVADIAIHRPDRHGDQRNHHAHILLTMRELDGDNFSTRKQRDWNRTELLEYWREQWADYQNDALEAAGYDARVDHRSFEEQGIDREPTWHLGKDASAMEREGKASRIGDENREIERHNRQLDSLVGELAVVDAEISRELERAFSAPELETEIEEPQPGREGPEGGRKEKRPLWEAQAESHSVFTSDITRAYMERGAETPEEERERSERRWYEELYNRTMETVQHYWAKFVDKVTLRREEREREIDDPER